jgi:hypothetical protein
LVWTLGHDSSFHVCFPILRRGAKAHRLLPNPAEHAADVLEHRHLFCRGLDALDPLVGEHALQQHDQAIPVLATSEQRGKRLDRLFRLVAADDFLLAAANTGSSSR